MKKLIVLFFVSALLMGLMAQLIFENDDAVSAIEAWVPQQSEVRSKAGDNVVLELRGKTSVNATQSKPAQSVYTFSINGSTGMGMLVVEVSDSNEMKIKHLIID